MHVGVHVCVCACGCACVSIVVHGAQVFVRVDRCKGRRFGSHWDVRGTFKSLSYGLWLRTIAWLPGTSPVEKHSQSGTSPSLPTTCSHVGHK